MWQTISMFEIFHAAFELSPGASVAAVCVNFSERMMLLIACLLPFPQLRTNAHVSVPFVAWSTTNIVRFACASPRSSCLHYCAHHYLCVWCNARYSSSFDAAIQLFCVRNPASSVCSGHPQPHDCKFSFRRNDEVSCPVFAFIEQFVHHAGVTRLYRVTVHAAAVANTRCSSSCCTLQTHW